MQTEGFDFEEVRLKPGKEDSFNRRHHWIFSGALHAQTLPKKEGTLCKILTAQGKELGWGFSGTQSIAVRIVSHQSEISPPTLLRAKLSEALNCRISMGYTSNPKNTAWRWVHGEGDGLPGLIVDVYGSHVIVQFHHVGWNQLQDELLSILRELFPGDIETLALKPVNRGQKEEVSFIAGDTGAAEILESGISMYADWAGGQKTGFFLDQRVNRERVLRYAEGKSVLNLFSYTGGFSLASLSGGASEVCSVDVAGNALEACEKMVALNNFPGKHSSVQSDVMEYLKGSEKLWDIVICDPPAFAKSVKSRHRAIQAYTRLNQMAIKAVKPGGLLFTFSCSQVVNDLHFSQLIVSAGLAAGRNLRIIEKLTQSGDHPVNPYHPETAYLKGLLLYVA
jgi:23S rRNA (cytosine1962-C5)-methyltransferase